MSQTISVLVAVDVEGALSSGNLNDNVFMVDTTGYAGAGDEGGHELTTVCNNGDTINWRVEPIAPSTVASIKSFQGTAVSDGVIAPTESSDANGPFWTSLVETRSPNTYQYTMTLDFEGKDMTFDPYLDVKS